VWRNPKLRNCTDADICLKCAAFFTICPERGKGNAVLQDCCINVRLHSPQSALQYECVLTYFIAGVTKMLRMRRRRRRGVGKQEVVSGILLPSRVKQLWRLWRLVCEHDNLGAFNIFVHQTCKIKGV